MAKLDLIGEKYFIMCESGIFLGQIEEFADGVIRLSTMSRVVTRGKLSIVLSTGTLEEVEFFGNNVYIQTGATVLFLPWNHALPTVST